MMRIDNLNYVDKAENTIRDIKAFCDDRANRQRMITTSQIRNILALITQLSSDVRHHRDNKLTDDMLSRLQYIRMRLAYESGRDRAVRYFVEQTELLEIIKEIGTSRDNRLLFCRYMEALVAFHKFYGGRD